MTITRYAPAITLSAFASTLGPTAPADPAADMEPVHLDRLAALRAVAPWLEVRSPADAALALSAMAAIAERIEWNEMTAEEARECANAVKRTATRVLRWLANGGAS
jgi:hypothetical protein